MLLRVWDNHNQKYQYKSNIDKLISIHGNRFILHYYLEQILKKYNLKSDYLSDLQIEVIKNIIIDNLNDIVVKISQIKDCLYPEAYPANLFRNGKRCKDVYKKLISEFILKEREIAAQ